MGLSPHEKVLQAGDDIPSVTLPPALDKPPRARKAMTMLKLPARAQGIWVRLTNKRLIWRTQNRPSSSDQGALQVEASACISQISSAMDALRGSIDVDGDDFSKEMRSHTRVRSRKRSRPGRSSGHTRSGSPKARTASTCQGSRRSRWQR